jgi:ankyrin repeat protein
MSLKIKIIIVLLFSFYSIFPQGSMILFSAIDSENINLVKDSIHAGSDINAKNGNGLTPIMYAIKKNSISIVNYFLTLPINIEIEDNEGNNLLHYLSSNEDGVLLNNIFKNDKVKNLINKKNQSGISPLFIAVENTNLLLVNSLMLNGADINEINSEAKSILLLSHEKNLSLKSVKSKKILHGLIENSSNVNIHTSNTIKENSNTKKSLLYEATELEDIELCNLLIKKGANIKEKFEGNSLLHLSTKVGNKNLVSLYLSYALLVDERGENGETPFMIALKKGNPSLIQFLISKGANINLANTNGDTPLSIAVGNADLKNVQLLIQSKADVNHLNELGNNLLMEAVKGDINKKQEIYDIISLLVKSGLKINSKNIYGNTALSYMINKKNIKLIKYLIKLGADVNISDSLGNTPLHKVVLLSLFDRLKNKELDEIIEILFLAGVDPNIRNNEGLTPLHIAVKPYNEKDEKAAMQVAQKLLDYSADPSIEDRLGANCFDYAKGQMLALLNISREKSKPDLEFKGITNTIANDNSLGLAIENEKVFHLGEFENKKIASQFLSSGKLEKQVLLEGAVKFYNNSNDGLYFAKELKEISKTGVCKSKLYLQKLNYKLEEYWNTLLEEPLLCNQTEMISVIGDNKNNVYIQYKYKNKIKLIKIDLLNGTRVSEITSFEIFQRVFNFQDKLYFVGKQGFYVYSNTFQFLNKRNWNEKKNLIVYFDDKYVYSVLPLISRPGFSITKSDFELDTIWKKKFSSLSEDTPIFIEVLDSEIYVSGETKGNLHGNRNFGKETKDIFLLKLDSNGNRKYTYQIGSKSDDKILGMNVDNEKKVYLHGISKDKIYERESIGEDDIFILRYK